ncbi:BQ2448_5269 [Microbotryum intermedium]|uniref:BQ2448_5269 protein n=1 Tax=Microbotryum intermedium TaxID=269621 RepID=A0A238F908_9BASI|nr:BQ2448_5269 [Microbotryum intermedium]
MDNALSRRPFKVTLAPTPSSSVTAPARQLKRIHVAAEVLKARKICAGDALVIRPRPAAAPTTASLEDGISALSINKNEQPTSASTSAEPPKFAVGVAWPSFTLSASASDSAVAVSSLLLANSGLTLGEDSMLNTFADSGLSAFEADTITLIYGSKGKAAKDSFFEAYAKEVLVDIRYVALHHFVELTFNGVLRRLLVSSARPAPTSPPFKAALNQVFLVSRSTSVTFKPPIAPLPNRRTVAASPAGASGSTSIARTGDMPGYEAIGGMQVQIEQIRELVEWPLTRPEVFSHFGLRPPRGILLYGPPGTGKTLLAYSIAQSTRSTLLTINGPSLSSAYHGETEARLRDVFAEAKRKSPAVIVIDEVDALAPNREEGGEVERRVVATLLTLMDGLEEKDAVVDSESGEEVKEEGETEERPRVVVVAATNRPNAIDPALRRPGRFDKEIEIGVPDAASRLSILRVLLRRTPHALDEATLTSAAARTHGFVGADLSSLVHTAGLNAIKRSFNATNPSPAPSNLSDQKLLASDLEGALLSTRPSAMREVFLETPKVKWSDIGGQAHVKARLRECVEWPLLHPETFKRLGVRPPRGVLLYGPPGCSKTLIAKALANEGGLNFIAVKGPEVFNKYVGESEKGIREIFRKARAAAPSIVFLRSTNRTFSIVQDEIDALAPVRGSDDSSGPTGDRVLMSLLTEMDGIEELNGVIVLGATNRPHVIDPALMRPGRLDRILYVAPPDHASRIEIFQLAFNRMSISSDVEVEELASMTEGCSGAEIAGICQDGALNAMNEHIEIAAVGRRHLVEAAKSIRRRITTEVVRGYEEWSDRSGVRSA